MQKTLNVNCRYGGKAAFKKLTIGQGKKMQNQDSKRNISP